MLRHVVAISWSALSARDQPIYHSIWMGTPG
ncbi:hypothetical protein VIF_003401 [Vibrio cholerae TM 11079-80]|nr:hypothetical protein VIF_003401 [Vibrio cholerae TM 11079-80]EEO21940.1 hypothetical protein VCF_001893 [Vibrio cholerae BX 330286]